MRVFSVVPVLLLLSIPVSQADTIHVPDEYSTIQAGIDAAEAGDTVLIECGTYYEHDITLKDNITVRSENGEPECVIIDAQQNGRVFVGEGVGSGSLLEGLTITGGNEIGNDDYYEYGGGAFFNFEAPDFSNCVLSGNFAEYGGALALRETSSTMTDCVLGENVGGGLACLDDCSATLTNCEINDNVGRGLIAWGLYGNTGGGWITLNDCEVARNTRAGLYVMQRYYLALHGCQVHDNQGRGIDCHYNTTVNDCELIGNGGSGLSFFTYYYFEPAEYLNIVGSIVQGNAHNGLYLQIAGHEYEYAEVTVTDCVITDNDIAGLHVSSMVFSTLTLYGCTLAKNGSVGLEIPGIHPDVQVENFLIAFNDGVAVDGMVDLSCCDLFGNIGGDWVGWIGSQLGREGNISEDPLFCDAASGNYMLRSDSPCLPAHNDCGTLIGALGEGCPTAAQETSWSQVKSLY